MKKIVLYIYNFIANYNKLRILFWRLFFKEAWKNIIIMKNCTFYSPHWISLWNNVFINFNCILDGKWEIKIWNDVQIAPNVRIWTFNHKIDNINIPINKQWNIYKKVVIWNDVWIWDWSIILPWVKIWNWVVIWAGSIVTKNLDDYSIVWGNPAKLIKKRK